jgi:2-hydroxychromene-2-carboxylate isomerase
VTGVQTCALPISMTPAVDDCFVPQFPYAYLGHARCAAIASVARRMPLNLQPRFFPVTGDDAARPITAVDLNDGTEAAVRLASALLGAVWTQKRDIADAAVLSAVPVGQGLGARRLAKSRSLEVFSNPGMSLKRA